LVERGVSFVLLPLYTYVLSPDQFGVYAVLLSFIAVLSFFYSLGIENNLFTFSADPERDQDLMGTAFWTAIGGRLYRTARRRT
jgi:O-antigen/teichoic acid export membrane protein